ncbi:MAG: PAS domain S-box protein, partial [Candidatus Caldarchaeum sp.]
RGNLAIGVRLKGGAELSAIALGVNRLIEELVKRGIEVDVYKRACRRLLAEPWDWTLLCDIRGRIVDVSQELLRALGYVEDEMLGLDINEVFASGASDLKRHLTDSLGDGEHLMFESFLKRRNGGLVPVEVRCGRIEFPQGPLFRLVARDLTTEQELQDLRNQRDVFRRMLDGSVNPIIGLTREGVIHYANGSSSFILKGWGVTVGMEAPDEVKGAASSAFSLGLKRDAEVSVGEMRTLLSFVPHDDGVMVYGYAPAWDKGANGAKTAYALREKAIVGALPDAALLVDGDDKVVAVNPRFEETFGHVALGEAVDAVFGLIEHNLASPTCFADHGKMGSTSCLEEMVTLRDGRVFRASLIPLLAEGDVCGRLFYFKEIKTLDSSHAPVLGTYPPSLSPSFGDGLSYLELFANSAPFMVWMLSLDGSYSFVSSRFLGFLGADSERSSLLDIIHPEDVTLILNDVGSAFSGGGRVIREARVKSARGVKRVRLVGEPLSLPDGSFKGYFGTCEAIWEGNKSSQMGASKTRWWKRAIGLLGFFKELIFRR